MEQKFKKLLQKNRAQMGQKDPLFKTFEGALFENSAWFFQTEETPIEVMDGKAPSNSLAPESGKQIPPMVQAPEELGPAPLCEVLFVGDTYKGEGDDLLGKMISAMKLTGQEFHRYQLDEELENVSDLADNLLNPSSETKKLLDIISAKRPKVVVSLGATVTNVLLGKREKLSTIHGQFIVKKALDWSYSLMPVFHPDFLVINPNMKRTAWIDLQKVMERVGKI